jgi:hypothetical protein
VYTRGEVRGPAGGLDGIQCSPEVRWTGVRMGPGSRWRRNGLSYADAKSKVQGTGNQ